MPQPWLYFRLGASPWLGLIVGAALAGVLGLVCYPVFRLRGHYFAVATMAVAEIVFQPSSAGAGWRAQPASQYQ